MTCQEAERLVTPYIRGELDGDELEEFLRHVDSCADCREELEIYYMVNVGLEQLDNDDDIQFGNFDIVGRLRRRLAESRAHIRHLRSVQKMAYAAETVAVMALIVTTLLQFRIWFMP
jgi:hypothetical protein